MSDHVAKLTRVMGRWMFEKTSTVTITASGWGHLAIVVDYDGEITNEAERDFEGPFERDKAMEEAEADFLAMGYTRAT